ncbi:TIGR03986 family type III CRISPR-associated RAMP protein [Sinosporangium siamense]|nr:TIGR03986 family CRISPR-associated RAMP protein [Sinosporangium siamense]
MHEFLNPYTFIPAFPRRPGTLPPDLADGPPPSRDRLRPDCWTGTIGVTLTVETPLLLVDTARAAPPSRCEDGHFVYPVRLRDGKPHLPATSVKGMLRAAYEAVTNSRFGVFEPHDEPFGFRRSADFALRLVPVMVTSTKKILKFEVAGVKMYDKKTGRDISAEEWGWTPAHRDRVQARIREKVSRRYGKEIRTARVIGILPKDSTERFVKEHGELIVSGAMCVTGPTIEGKTTERLFYARPGSPPPELRTAKPWETLEAEWDLLIRNYRDAHTDDELLNRKGADGLPAGPGERIGDGPGRLAWSPHLHDQDRMRLTGGTLCFASLNDRDEVVRLYPVLVPRDLYDVTPASLLGDTLAPAPSYDRLSPADRVFGWVAPHASGRRPSGYRGRLSVGPVRCVTDAAHAVHRFDGDGLALAILGQPKPQQGRFYVSESAERPERPVPDGTGKEALYRAGRGLRGRKAYWHHAGLDPVDHWRIPSQGDPAQLMAGGRYREYVRSRAVPEGEENNPRIVGGGRRYFTTAADQRDNQNRSIGGWVNPGTEFSFTVDVRDLDDHELGALVWLLSLPEGHFHRLGLGRPLGFGSVRLSIDHAATRLHSGRQYAAFYSALSGVLPDEDCAAVAAGALAVFNRRVDGIPALVKVRDALLAVARGNPDLPVHYPRTRDVRLSPAVTVAPPDPRGRNFEWFSENERLEKGRVAPGRGRALPAADAKDPLTAYPAKGGNGQWGNTRRSSDGGGGKSGRPSHRPR